MALGFGFGFGRLKGAAVPTISAPALTWTGDTTDSRPDFDVNIPVGSGTAVAAGDVLRLQYSGDGGSNWSAYLTHTLTSGEITGDPITVSGVSALVSGNYLFRARLERGVILSAWSASETVTLVIVALASGTPIGLLLVLTRAGNPGEPIGLLLTLTKAS